MAGGDWGAAIAAPGWPGRDVTVMDSLFIWVFAPQEIPAASLPVIYLEDISNQKTSKINISNYHDNIPQGYWTRISIPIDIFIANPGNANLNSIKVIYFGMGIDDGIERTMFIDEVKMVGGSTTAEYKYIVVLGSSTAAGIGPTSPDSAWVNRFRKYVTTLDTSYKIINLAVGGYTTYHIMPTGFVPPGNRPYPAINNNITKALSYNPDVVLINMPSNDAANNYSMTEQIANYDSLESVLDSSNISFWVSTPQPRNFSNQNQLNLLFAMRDSTYSRYGNHLVDFWNDLAQLNGWINPIYNSGDGVHLNNYGHRLLFERMRDAVVPVILSSDLVEVSKNEIDFKLNNNFPNPFNPSTTISFYVPVNALIILDVFNALGEKVTNLVYGEKVAGSHSVTFNAQGFSSGVYIYRMFAVDNLGKHHSDSNKMLLIK